MKMFLYQALLLLGWLGITAGGGAELHAQQKVVYDQYFYFNSFETDADLEGWTYSSVSSWNCLDGKSNISSGNDGYISSPKFDLRSLKKPVISVDVSIAYHDLLFYVSYDGKKYR